MPDYKQLIEKIAKASGLEVDEIDRKVDAKCAKLSGLISKEGSAQIVASELGVNFESEKVKVSELSDNTRRANLIAKIITEPVIRDFTTKAGNPGKVLSMEIADDTGSIRTVLWDTNHISFFEEGKIKNNDMVEVVGGGIRNSELHLSGFSEIKLSDEVIGEVKRGSKMVEKKILDLKVGEKVKLRAVIVKIFEPRFFEVCPECNKKVVEGKCDAHGNITPVKKALIGLVLDDGSENMRGVLFSEQIKAIGISDEELEDGVLFMKKKKELLGKEAYFDCNVRNNALFNNVELIVNAMQDIDLDGLIEGLKG